MIFILWFTQTTAMARARLTEAWSLELLPGLLSGWQESQGLEPPPAASREQEV